MTLGAGKIEITDAMSIQRRRMIDRLRDHYGIKDQAVLDAMARIPRHLFVPSAIRAQAYNDNALPISNGQTISQPFIVARMTELVAVDANSRVLEIGSGSGYQTAVLASLVYKVYAIERIDALEKAARGVLSSLGVSNVEMTVGDGSIGWRERAPFDAILVAAVGPDIPSDLIAQLKPGGRLVMPVGVRNGEQRLVRLINKGTRPSVEDCGPCAFVPLIGKQAWPGSGRI